MATKATTAAVLAASALSSTALAGVTLQDLGAFNDTDFVSLLNNGFVEQGVVESRIGNAAPESGIWETAIWDGVPSGTPDVQAGRGISSGNAVNISLTYDGAGSLTFTVDGVTISNTTLLPGPFDQILIRTRSVNDSTSLLSGLVFSGEGMTTTQFGVGSVNNDVSYFSITADDGSLGAFTITGTQTFGWLGNNRPNNSALSGQFKFIQTPNFVPTPGAAGLLGLAGLAATRRRR